MKKLIIYYLYLITVVVLTSFLIVSIIIAICLKHFELLELFLSLIVFDGFLWIIVIIKKPSIKEIHKIITAENDKNDLAKLEIKKQLDDIMQQVNECQEDANELQRQHDKHKDVLSSEEKD